MRRWQRMVLVAGLLALMEASRAQATTTTTTTSSSTSSSSTSSSSTSTSSTSSTTLAVGYGTASFQTSCDTESLPVLPKRSGRLSAMLKNMTSSVTVYVCLADPCSSTTGYPLAQNETLRLMADKGAVTYVATGAATLAVTDEYRF